MLKSVLSAKECGQCRNCCVFFSKSRWETPSVMNEKAAEITKFLNNPKAVEKNGNIYKIKSVLRDKIPHGKEEYKCPALDENKGCTLPPELKPVECSMWPLRVMNDDSELFITLASGCHAVNKEFTVNIKKLLNNGLYEKILDAVRKNKALIRNYDKSYIKLMKIAGENTDEQ